MTNRVNVTELRERLLAYADQQYAAMADQLAPLIAATSDKAEVQRLLEDGMREVNAAIQAYSKLLTEQALAGGLQ